MNHLRLASLVLAVGSGCTSVGSVAKDGTDCHGVWRSQRYQFADAKRQCDAAYREFLKTHSTSPNAPNTAMVRKVGAALRCAAEEYDRRFVRPRGMNWELDLYDWDFQLVESDEVNAWSMLGGGVVVYTGILPICDGEAGLATVMGHEVAHAIKKHAMDRMFTESLTNISESFGTLFATGAEYGVELPFSRAHEVDADRLGLLLMALAGYDPAEALAFWQRMDDAQGQADDDAKPWFARSHPSSSQRTQALANQMPAAQKLYAREGIGSEPNDYYCSTSDCPLVHASRQ